MPLSSIDSDDRAYIEAYLVCGTFEQAAKDCGVSTKTVSRAWHRWRASFVPILRRETI